MRTSFTFLFTYLFLVCHGQEENPVVFGKVHELSVAQNGRVWLTTQTGNIYGLDSINGNWRIIMESNPNVEYDITKPNMDGALFINEELALVYGYISSDFYKEKKCKVMKTSDGGKGWYSIPFTDQDSWVRDVQLLPNQDIYMGSSDGNLYFSSTHGNDWVRIPVKFKKQKEAYDRDPEVYSLHFTHRDTGLITNRDNLLAYSTDGFATYKLLPTPLDQGLFPKQYKPYYLNGSGRKYVSNWKIDEVGIFHDWFIIKQNNKVYYTNRNSIKWEEFNVPIIDFEFTESGKLWFFDAQMSILKVEDDLSLSIYESLVGEEYYQDFKATDQAIYFLIPEYADKKPQEVVRETHGNLSVVQTNVRRISGYLVYRITDSGIESSIIYGPN